MGQPEAEALLTAPRKTCGNKVASWACYFLALGGTAMRRCPRSTKCCATERGRLSLLRAQHVLHARVRILQGVLRSHLVSGRDYLGFRTWSLLAAACSWLPWGLLLGVDPAGDPPRPMLDPSAGRWPRRGSNGRCASRGACRAGFVDRFRKPGDRLSRVSSMFVNTLVGSHASTPIGGGNRTEDVPSEGSSFATIPS